MVELTPDVAVVKYTTAQGDQFELRIEIPENFPAAMPETYVSKPKPLKTKDGKNMIDIGASHGFHLLRPKDGYVFLGVEFLLHSSTTSTFKCACLFCWKQCCTTKEEENATN